MEKAKSIGSCYLNTSKDTPQEAKDKLAGVVKWMQENKIQLSLSVHHGKLASVETNDRGYCSFIGFTNSYKKTPKDADIVLYPKMGKKGGGNSYSAPAPKEDLPF